MKTIVEGGTKFKAYTADIVTKSMPVFYNPVKEFDRTLSVKIVKELGLKKGLDLLCASGARGIRMMREAGMSFDFNDLNPKAVKLTRANLKLNNLKAKVTMNDANELLFSGKDYYDFIDIDPFGSPSEFLQGAIKRLNRNGVLAVTATDTAALNGARPKAGLRKYHAHIERHSFMKETGLRLLIRHVIEKGAELEMAMTPIISHSTAHYYRAYFKKDLGALRCDELLKNIKNIYYCRDCGERWIQGSTASEASRHGQNTIATKECDDKNIVALGPVYTGKINSLKVNDDFVRSLNAEDEFPPWYFVTTELKLGQEPKMELLLKKFKAVRSHYEPKAFKTNLSFSELKN